MGHEPNDLDFVVYGKDMVELKKIIHKVYQERDILLNRNKYVYKISLNDTDESLVEYKVRGESELTLLGHELDIDLIRSKLNIMDNSFEISNDLKLDAMHRDFTVDCIYYNYDAKTVEDVLNGMEDLKNNVLRIANGQQSFYDSPLIMFRLIKLQVRYSMKLDNELRLILQNEIFMNRMVYLLI